VGYKTGKRLLKRFTYISREEKEEFTIISFLKKML
jgi:hypothetical protein